MVADAPPVASPLFTPRWIRRRGESQVDGRVAGPRRQWSLRNPLTLWRVHSAAGGGDGQVVPQLSSSTKNLLPAGCILDGTAFAQRPSGDEAMSVRRLERSVWMANAA